MSPKNLPGSIFLLLLVLAMPFLSQHARADEAPVAVVKTLSGEVSIVRAGASLPAGVGSDLLLGDELLTGPTGAVGFTFTDESRLSLGPASRYRIERYSFDAGTHEGEFRSRLARGSLGVISGRLAKQSPEAVKVETPLSVLGVRGTEFLIEVDPEGLQ
jgi:hypothetical protein